MELLAIVLFCLVVAILAPRFGYDSRERMQSNEEQLACYGLTWGAALPRSLRQPRGGGLRHTLARPLYALAAWLNPELREARGLR